MQGDSFPGKPTRGVAYISTRLRTCLRSYCFRYFSSSGLVLLQKNVPRLQDRWRLEKEGIPTSGVIESTDGGKRCTRSITVRYTVKSEDRGQHMWHRSFDTTCSPYQAGQTAAVVYLPAAPSVAILGPQEAGIPRKQVVVGAGIGAFLKVLAGSMRSNSASDADVG